MNEHLRFRHPLSDSSSTCFPVQRGLYVYDGDRWYGSVIKRGENNNKNYKNQRGDGEKERKRQVKGDYRKNHPTISPDQLRTRLMYPLCAFVYYNVITYYIQGVGWFEFFVPTWIYLKHLYFKTAVWTKAWHFLKRVMIIMLNLSNNDWNSWLRQVMEKY